MFDPETFDGIGDKSDLTPAAREVLEDTDFEHVIGRLEGRDGGLRPSKPQAQGDNGLIQYVWRMARFHSGDDPKMPVTADWDLIRYLKDGGYLPDERGARRSREYEEIEGLFDLVSRVAVRHYGRDPDAGLKRWQKAVFG